MTVPDWVIAWAMVFCLLDKGLLWLLVIFLNDSRKNNQR